MINAIGSIADVQASINTEFRYQSTLELSTETFEMIRMIPLSEELQRGARQRLIGRLEYYRKAHTKLLGAVVQLIMLRIVPMLERHTISGAAPHRHHLRRRRPASSASTVSLFFLPLIS